MSGTDQGGATILVVASDKILLELFRQYVAMKQDVEARFAEDQEQLASQLNWGFKPAAGVVDVPLADAAGGIEICRLVKERSPECTLFVLCGSAAMTQAVFPGDLHIQEFVEKPFTFDTLMDHIGKAVHGPKKDALAFTQFPEPESAEVTALARLLERKPDAHFHRHLFAFSLYTAKRYKEALEQYEMVYDAGFHNFLSLYYMGHTLARMHQYERAIRTWTEALAFASSPDVAKNVTKRIDQVKQMMAVG